MGLKWGWQYGSRVTPNPDVTLDHGLAGRIEALGVAPGQCRYVHKGWLTHEAKLGTPVSVTWTEGQAKHSPETLALLSNPRVGRARLREDAGRMSTAPSGRETPSGGFERAHPRWPQAPRWERLPLALAIATVWCHELGEHVLAEGEACRREIDPGPERKLSRFQLGLRWLKRCVSTGIHRLPAFMARWSPVTLPPVVKVCLS